MLRGWAWVSPRLALSGVVISIAVFSGGFYTGGQDFSGIGIARRVKCDCEGENLNCRKFKQQSLNSDW